LRRGTRRLCTSRVVHAGCLDRSDDLRRSRLEGRKVGLIPDGGGLFFKNFL
jgi:hypothetical protein